MQTKSKTKAYIQSIRHFGRISECIYVCSSVAYLFEEAKSKRDGEVVPFLPLLVHLTISYIDINFIKKNFALANYPVNSLFVNILLFFY